MGGHKSLGLGGRCQDVMDCDESPWEGMGGPKSLGLGGRCQDVMDCDESPWEGKGWPKSLGPHKEDVKSRRHRHRP